MPSLHTMVNPRSTTGRGARPSIWRGRVASVSASTVWVHVHGLSDDDLRATNTLPQDLVAGDRVIIAMIQGRVDALVILAKEVPTVPEHVHPDTDVAYPGWASAVLASGFTGGPDATTFQGLRYRTDARFLHLHGHVTGGAGLITTLPVAPPYTSQLVAFTEGGSAVPLVLGTDGALTTTAVGGLYITASAPLS